MKIDKMSPQEYAALWGCDGSYDRLPNQPGDGALFYNYGCVSDDWDTKSRILFYDQFIPAIERTLSDKPHEPSHSNNKCNKCELFKLLAYVKAQKRAIEESTSVEAIFVSDRLDSNESHFDSEKENLWLLWNRPELIEAWEKSKEEDIEVEYDEDGNEIHF